jgi:HK97 family phage prohead protease
MPQLAEAYLRLEIKEISEAGEFEGWLSTYGNTDLGGDVIATGAFGTSLKARDGKVRILLDHDTTKRAGTGFITETPEGLYCKGILNLDSPYGRQAYAEVKFYQLNGPPMELSIGYKTRKDRWEQNTRHILEGDLWEGSLVCFAMNPQALVTSVKAQEGGMDHSDNPAPPETKQATPFERIYRLMKLYSARWQMADALWSSVESILTDSRLDEAGQNAAAEQSLGQFNEAVMAWMGEYRALYGEASGDSEALAADLALELKAGRVLSARNKELLAAAVEALSAVLKAAEPQEDGEEEDEGEEDDDESKAAPAPVTGAADEPFDAVAFTGLAAEMRAFIGGRNGSHG